MLNPKRGLLLLALCLLLPASAAAREPLYPQMVPVRAAKGSEAVLYAQPAETSEALGVYHNGATAETLRFSDEWSMVTFGWTDAYVTGYMRTSDLAFDGNFMHALPSARVTAESVTPRLTPDESGEPLINYLVHTDRKVGAYPKGSLLELWGQYGSWCQVRMGQYIGFVPAETIAVATDRYVVPPPDGGLQELGYGLLKVPPDTEGWDVCLPMYACPDAAAPVLKQLDKTAAVEIQAQLGEWTQVRHFSDAYVGYVRSEQITPYLLADLLIEESVPLVGAGTYTMGDTLPAGLYVLRLTEGKQAALTVADRTWQWTGAGRYTLYLPPQVTLTLTGDGQLLTHPGALRFDAVNRTYVGSGRFLIGVEGPNRNYQIKLAPGATEGSYTVSDLNWDAGQAEPPARIPLAPDRTDTITLDKGQFIEIENAELYCEWGNG